MNKEEIKNNIKKAMLVLTTLIITSMELKSIKIEKDTKKLYKDFADVIVDGFQDNKIMIIDERNTYDVTNVTNDTTLTTGDYLCESLIEQNIKCWKYFDDYYTLDGREVYFYTLEDGSYEVFDDSNFKYLNGMYIKVDTEPYIKLLDYDFVLDVYENMPVTVEDGENSYTGYIAERKLVKKR